MALSSQSLNKRSCQFGYGLGSRPNSSANGSPSNGSNGPKRMCLGLAKDALSYRSVVAFCSSSENDDDLDEQSCYNADQVKAKRRASTRMSFSVNPNVSRAIAKYSDEDDEHNQDDLNDENIDCKLLSSTGSSICLGKLKRRGTLMSDDYANANVNSGVSNYNAAASSPMKRLVPLSDKNARSRCFDYLVTAIDEAWARYCNATSYAEDEEYGYSKPQMYANTPASVATDDEDYFGNSTDITDYEDCDFDQGSKQHRVKGSHKQQMYQKLLPVKPTCSSEYNPSSSQLQELKDRLTKAKYFLQDLVDSEDVLDVNSFWKRWDMIKYATIELVEDDDDDEIVEGTIEELEEGRFYAN